MAGSDHHDELPGRIAPFEGRDVAARHDTVRAEDGAARVFPFGVAFRRARGPPPRRRRAMANDDHAPSARVRWARLRFQILGPLLAAPADDGELKARIPALAARPWRHPTTARPPASRSASRSRPSSAGGTSAAPWTIRWPCSRAKVPSHAGTHPAPTRAGRTLRVGGAGAHATRRARRHRAAPAGAPADRTSRR